MTRTLFRTAAIMAMLATPAVGANLYRTPSSPYVAAPYGGYNWGGFYVGLNLGYEWGSVTNSAFNHSGFAGGGQAGYNWQRGSFVFGVETDLQASGADQTIGGAKFSNTWFGTLRGRGGIAFNNALMYLTAGLAYGGGQLDFAGLSETHGHIGWAAGGGLEVGFTPNWSAKAEYLYIDLTQQNYILTALPHAYHSNLLRFGVNYRF